MFWLTCNLTTWLVSLSIGKPVKHLIEKICAALAVGHVPHVVANVHGCIVSVQQGIFVGLFWVVAASRSQQWWSMVGPTKALLTEPKCGISNKA